MNLARLRENRVALHAISTGAGAELQRELWAEPGASAYFSGASFPYGENETTELLGFRPERFCAGDTALDLASAAYMKVATHDDRAPVGIGLTASVASHAVHRGEHRVHCAVLTTSVALVASAVLEKRTGKLARRADDATCAALALATLGQAFGEPGPAHDATELATARFFERPYFDALGRRHAHALPEPFALLPGAFDPPHAAHLAIADEVERNHGFPVVFEIAAAPPHKPPLGAQALLRRARLLRGRRVLVTRGEALYIEKARRFPGVPLVLGADALHRMLDPKWGPSIGAMLDEFRALGTTFYVSSRVVAGEHLTAQNVLERHHVEGAHRALFVELATCSALSSTELRKRYRRTSPNTRPPST